jgi:hypothetical protein
MRKQILVEASTLRQNPLSFGQLDSTLRQNPLSFGQLDSTLRQNPLAPCDFRHGPQYNPSAGGSCTRSHRRS